MRFSEYYSYLSEFTGLDLDAFTEWYITVISVSNATPRKVRIKMPGRRLVLYANSINQVLNIQMIMGVEIRMAIVVYNKN